MTEAGHHYTLLAGTSWLDAQDVANAALYLNSDLASKVTGVTIPVDAATSPCPDTTRYPRGERHGAAVTPWPGMTAGPPGSRRPAG